MGNNVCGSGCGKSQQTTPAGKDMITSPRKVLQDQNELWELFRQQICDSQDPQQLTLEQLNRMCITLKKPFDEVGFEWKAFDGLFPDTA